MATLPFPGNLLSGMADAGYIEIDRTPKDDGNGAYKIDVEEMFRHYKEWLRRSDGGDELTQTLCCAKLFEAELHALDALRRRDELPWVPHFGLLSDDLLEDNVTWVLGVRPTTAGECNKAPEGSTRSKLAAVQAAARQGVEVVAVWWAAAMLTVAVGVATLAVASVASGVATA